MSKKTFFSLIALSLIPMSLFVGILLYQQNTRFPNQNQVSVAKQVPKKTPSPPSPTPYPVESILSFSPQEGQIKSSEKFSVKVIIDSKENAIIASHLSLFYPPQYLTLLSIRPASAFEDPQVLDEIIDQEKGEITYVLGTLSYKKTKGELVIIDFQTKKVNQALPISLKFGPDTQLSAPGYQFNVLKNSQEAHFTLLP